MRFIKATLFLRLRERCQARLGMLQCQLGSKIIWSFLSSAFSFTLRAGMNLEGWPLGLGIYERNIYLQTASWDRQPPKERANVLFVLVKAFQLASDGKPIVLRLHGHSREIYLRGHSYSESYTALAVLSYWFEFWHPQITKQADQF